jgi:P-type E1-E2 ATPase
MVQFAVPGREPLSLKYLVLDLNGTLTLDGALIDGVAERLELLRAVFDIYLLTADMRGTAVSLAGDLQVHLKRIQPTGESQQKQDFVMQLGHDEVVAIGAGANDAQMLASAALGIAVLGPEGLATSTLRASDVAVPSINAALDMLAVPERLIATLRD